MNEYQVHFWYTSFLNWFSGERIRFRLIIKSLTTQGLFYQTAEYDIIEFSCTDFS